MSLAGSSQGHEERRETGTPQPRSRRWPMGAAGGFVFVAICGSHTQLWGHPGIHVCQDLSTPTRIRSILSSCGILSTLSPAQTGWGGEGRKTREAQDRRPLPCLWPRAWLEHLHRGEQAERCPLSLL